MYINDLFSSISGVFLTDFMPVGHTNKVQAQQFIIEHISEAYQDASSYDILRTIVDIVDLIEKQESVA